MEFMSYDQTYKQIDRDYYFMGSANKTTIRVKKFIMHGLTIEFT